MTSIGVPQISNPSREGLHHPVLDAVVNHFDEVARPTGTRMDIAMLGTLVATLGTGLLERSRAPVTGLKRSDPAAPRPPALRRSSCNSRVPGPHPTAGPDIQIENAVLPSSAARRMSSLKYVLPPSMIVSPFVRSVASSRIASSVGAPAGNMIHAVRGRSSFSENSGRLKAAVAPSSPRLRTAASLRS